MADTPTGETVTPEAPSNEPGTAAAPIADNSSVDVEAAKKEAEQARMRANQLENELKKIREAQEAEQRTKLEEKEEFKQLYESVNSQLEEMKNAQAAAERASEIKQATDSVLAEYPQNVQEVARTAGLSLDDDSDAAKALLKSKLDAIKQQVGTPAPSANNPAPNTPQTATREELVQRIRGGDKQALASYIDSIPGIQRMREIAQNGA